MPKQLSDAEYNYLIEQNQVADVANALWNDPELGPQAKALLKKKMPGLQIPDHDLRTEMRNEFAARDKKQAEDREKDRISREDAYWREQRSKTQSENNYTDDEMKDLEKFMVDNSVPSYEIAATYRNAKMPKPSNPETSSGYKDPYWNHGKSDTFKEIAKDPEEWGRSEIMKALTSQQNRNRNAF